MSAAADTRPTVKLTAEDLLGRFEAQSSTPLLEGRTIMCPLCESRRDILEYRTFQVVEKYASQVLPILKCPDDRCGHEFALHPDPEVPSADR